MVYNDVLVYETVFFLFKAKNTGLAALGRGFLTKKKGKTGVKYTSLNNINGINPIMKKHISLLLLVLITGSLAHPVSAQTFSYDFTTGYDEWTGDFADYPVTDSVFYELEFGRETLPSYIDPSKHALKISGKNHSDDLFMFIKRKVPGLSPNTTYQVRFEVEFASNSPTNWFGVGGAPGESVVMKAGATTIEPLKINTDGFYLMNIDKSNQVQPGKDMDTIGHVGVADTTTLFALINRNNSSHLFTVTTDANGEVWVCIGTDSGFEARTTLYYNQINLTFMVTTAVSDYIDRNRNFEIYPNPASERITLKTDPSALGQAYKIIDQMGKEILTGTLAAKTSDIEVGFLPSGNYTIQIGEAQKWVYTMVKK